MTKHRLNRRSFVDYYRVKVFTAVRIDTVIEDLIKGGEFIFTATELLDSMDEVEGKLVGVTGMVKAKDCVLYYEQN